MDMRAMIEAAYNEAATKAAAAKGYVGDKIQGVRDFIRPPVPEGQPDMRGLSTPTVAGLKQLEQQTGPAVAAPVEQMTNIGGDQAPLDPRATLVGPNGQRFTPEQMQQLQAALRQRQLPPQGSPSTVGLR